jgi:hypothetical protein
LAVEVDMKISIPEPIEAKRPQLNAVADIARFHGAFKEIERPGPSGSIMAERWEKGRQAAVSSSKLSTDDAASLCSAGDLPEGLGRNPKKLVAPPNLSVSSSRSHRTNLS